MSLIVICSILNAVVTADVVSCWSSCQKGKVKDQVAHYTERQSITLTLDTFYESCGVSLTLRIWTLMVTNFKKLKKNYRPSTMSVRQSFCQHGGSHFEHYLWYIGLHSTSPLPSNSPRSPGLALLQTSDLRSLSSGPSGHQTWDFSLMALIPDPRSPTSDIWWSLLEICLNLSIWGAPAWE